ncbi:MAG: hypothetical protein QOH52_2323 [Pseudonocardiales bacterium]|jgi:hypothetical protein|nr:hypothetical protein [Pseudonocardiales bacterium]
MALLVDAGKRDRTSALPGFEQAERLPEHGAEVGAVDLVEYQHDR